MLWKSENKSTIVLVLYFSCESLHFFHAYGGIPQESNVYIGKFSDLLQFLRYFEVIGTGLWVYSILRVAIKWNIGFSNE